MNIGADQQLEESMEDEQLSAVGEAAENHGYEVRGLAPTSRAAHKLAESGIESETLQRHLRCEEQPYEGRKWSISLQTAPCPLSDRTSHS
jgi:AAA domain